MKYTSSIFFAFFLLLSSCSYENEPGWTCVDWECFEIIHTTKPVDITPETIEKNVIQFYPGGKVVQVSRSKGEILLDYKYKAEGTNLYLTTEDKSSYVLGGFAKGDYLILDFKKIILIYRPVILGSYNQHILDEDIEIKFMTRELANQHIDFTVKTPVY